MNTCEELIEQIKKLARYGPAWDGILIPDRDGGYVRLEEVIDVIKEGE